MDDSHPNSVEIPRSLGPLARAIDGIRGKLRVAGSQVAGVASP
jgi:hypothetical protein